MRLILVPTLLLAASPLAAQDRFATTVIDYQQGTGGGIFDTNLILGGPRGAGLGNGSLDVLSLGVGGQVTLAFDVTLTDGPGADFSVFENAFAFQGNVFSEVALVEVSSNGIDFVRFPTRYSGPDAQQPPFGNLPYGTYAGLAGAMPVVANVSTNTVDPFDPVVAGGESFDLADLADDPLVQQGLVDPDAIEYVRLVDVPEGTIFDSSGALMWDNGGAASGTDIDAVAVIQHTGNQSADAPTIDLFLDDQGFAHCILGDPNGLGNLDWSSLAMSVNLTSVPFQRLRDFFTLLSNSPTELHLVSPNPIPGSTIRAVLAVSVKDVTGLFAGDQLSLHP